MKTDPFLKQRLMQRNERFGVEVESAQVEESVKEDESIVLNPEEHVEDQVDSDIEEEKKEEESNVRKREVEEDEICW